MRSSVSGKVGMGSRCHEEQCLKGKVGMEVP